MAGPAYSSAGGATNHMRGRRPTHMADAAGPFFMPCMGMKKEPAASYSRAGGSRTTLGDGALDFRVRNGNGYDCLSMATGPERAWSVGD